MYNRNKKKFKMDNFYELEKVLEYSDHFFCISHFNGNIDWTSKIKKSKYIIYNKSNKDLPNKFNNIKINNVGYNIYSYLIYIINNYENLPKTIVFCKDNVFTRHIEYKLFLRLLKRKVFTCLEETSIKNNFPNILSLADGGFTEINSSWYKYKHPRLYFANYNNFYNYIFKDISIPNFIRFSPGANYIVSRENILIRSKEFYQNLIKFICHSQYSCESHFLERSLYSIWNSNIESSDKMNSEINQNDEKKLKDMCFLIKSKENIYFEKIYQKSIFKIGNIYMKFFLRNSLN